MKLIKEDHTAVRYCLLVLIIFIGALFCEFAAAANIAEEGAPITITLGESTIVKAPWPTIRVAVTDPKVADVKVLSPTQILLQGNKAGSTDLIMWSEDEKKILQRKVKVEIDAAGFREKLNELFAPSALEVTQSADVLIVKGLLRSVEQAEQLHNYLDKRGVAYVDMTSVAGVQQVQLQVRVAEVSKKALRVLGVNATYADSDFFSAVTIAPSSGTPLITDLDIDYGSASGEFSSAVTFLAGIKSVHLNLFLQALAENQYLRILANPTLVALSGEEATFLAGGEYPIPVPQNVQGAAGTSITIDYKEYGVRLSFEPVVLGDGSIRLYTAPEVSDISDVGSVSITGFTIPALITRRFQTTLELKSGQTFAMAGLIKNNVTATTSRIPGIGDLPVLGALFSSKRYLNDETELVVLVTASLVEPMSVAVSPPLPGFLHSPPDDWEFYLEGRIESDRPVKISPADAAWLKQMGLDTLVGPGAWDSSYNPATSGQGGSKSGAATSVSESGNNK